MIEENSITESFEPAKELLVSDLDTLKVVSDPLRIQVLELLVSAPRTVKQLAAEMGTTPTKLYYHLNLLEEYGLVRVVSTRVVSGIIEKQYRVTAYSLRPDPAIFAPGGVPADEGLPMILAGIFERTQNDIKRSTKAGLVDFNRSAPEQLTILTRTLLHLSPERAAEFSSRLRALVAEYSPATTNSELTHSELTHGLMLAFYPLVRQADDPKQSEQSE